MVGHLRIITKSMTEAQAVRRFLQAVCGAALWQSDSRHGQHGDVLGYGTLEFAPEDVDAAVVLADRVVAAEDRATLATTAAYHFYHCRDCADGPTCPDGEQLIAALRGAAPAPAQVHRALALAALERVSTPLRDALTRCSQVGWPVDVQTAFYAWQRALVALETGASAAPVQAEAGNG